MCKILHAHTHNHTYIMHNTEWKITYAWAPHNLPIFPGWVPALVFTTFFWARTNVTNPTFFRPWWLTYPSETY